MFVALCMACCLRIRIFSGSPKSLSLNITLRNLDRKGEYGQLRKLVLRVLAQKVLGELLGGKCFEITS